MRITRQLRERSKIEHLRKYVSEPSLAGPTRVYFSGFEKVAKPRVIASRIRT